jgi:NADPH2:quinone reductase
MQAIVMTRSGDPDVLEIVETETPVIQRETELLVRLKAAGVNPVDTKLRAKGTYYPDRLPAILGCDGAGVVEAVGARVSRYRPGDAVYFCNGGIGAHPGNYAEYAVVDEAFAAPKPQRLDFAQAAALPLVLITAWESLHDRAPVAKNQRVLVHAGAGGVGHVAVQLAKLAGCSVCATVGDPDKARFVQSLGADLAILYRDEDFVAKALEWSDSAGVDVALDTIGGDTFTRTFGAVRVYGDVVTLLQPGADVDWKTARLRNQRISLELMLTPMYLGDRAAQRHQAGILEQGARMVDAGQLKVHLHRTFPMREAAAAHRLIERGGFMGKIALTIG